ncbi:ATP-dependent DNA helicase pcrA [Sebaldella termitidis]|jgi:DNA helicase-2/ATP-dependent DNA helicase PcrA|uniref:DNA 3'-5' helicase n=1 Tax=Sebaldella termitidis (strain ATCC 33386 / NCTC 11300) TaxID=526218 RepID=D1AL65_SEBTE|nr:UvrD-helicase domain-containing protein [Sebaldella termitidis]ACZ09208.1 UvrD/REP helicase [Sebaldella termitidis ATCC 33386]SUI24529.1 ATP-dependent DNA helicase pcrA [Sebaldella termitidis]
MSILDGLNKEQREAAEHIDGPVLILAGAGSGKTRTVTYRIAHMVREKGVSPLNILALTFTNKAAKEMKERAEALVGNDIHNLQISTFHSFSVRLLRIYGEKLGYGKNFNIYDTDDQKSLISKIMKELNVQDDSTPGKIANRISKLKEKGIDIKTIEREVDLRVPSNRVFFDIYDKYDKTLRSSNAMDFSDLILNANKLLDNSEVLERVQERYRYIIVDEYQDTNDLQYEIINKIASKYNNICVVGDEDQSIYAFRGANINNILNFERDYKNALVIKLEKNYRSTERILNAANELIRNNKSSRGKKLWTDAGKGEKIQVFNAANTFDEANFIAEEIVRKNREGVPFKDMAVLYRTNAQSRVLEEKMLLNNIKYRVYGGMQFFQRREVKDLLAYLSVINNIQDNLNFVRIINVPKRSIGDKSVAKFAEIAAQKGISLFESLKYIDEVSGLRAAAKEKLKDFYRLLTDVLENLEHMTVSEIFQEILNRTKYIDSIEDNKEDRVKNIEELMNSIREIEREYPGITLSEYLEFISLTSATDSMDDEENFVKLMTIHSSKGLEFDFVFIAGMEEGLFPGEASILNDEDLEEERRLCYVAITRAKKELRLSHASERMLWGQSSYGRPASRFIGELSQDELEFLNKKERKSELFRNTEPLKSENFKPMTDIENFNPYKKAAVDARYKIGEYVNHIKFGKGKVTGIDNKSVTVDFMTGEKKIALALADRFLKG